LAKNREIFYATRFKAVDVPVCPEGPVVPVYVPVENNGESRPSVNWFKAQELKNLVHLATDESTKTALYISPGKQI
jgi:hypothetical protein